MSGIRPPDCSKLAVDWENNADVIIYQHDLTYLYIKLFFYGLIYTIPAYIFNQRCDSKLSV